MLRCCIHANRKLFMEQEKLSSGTKPPFCDPCSRQRRNQLPEFGMYGNAGSFAVCKGVSFENWEGCPGPVAMISSLDYGMTEDNSVSSHRSSSRHTAKLPSGLIIAGLVRWARSAIWKSWTREFRVFDEGSQPHLPICFWGRDHWGKSAPEGNFSSQKPFFGDLDEIRTPGGVRIRPSQNLGCWFSAAKLELKGFSKLWFSTILDLNTRFGQKVHRVDIFFHYDPQGRIIRECISFTFELSFWTLNNIAANGWRKPRRGAWQWVQVFKKSND
jgi:hypothetical protein